MMEKLRGIQVSLDTPTSIVQQSSINGSMQQQRSTSNTQQSSINEVRQLGYAWVGGMGGIVVAVAATCDTMLFCFNNIGQLMGIK